MDETSIAQEIKTRLDRPVVLTGMMGAGKSHIGRLLAEALGIPFADSDRLVEERAGYRIAEIFARDGEVKFRSAEKAVILELLEQGVQVIATGGGALMDEETLAAVRENAVSIWLKADLAPLTGRLANAKDRPLLAGGNIRQTLENLLSKREPVYRQADITVNTIEGAIDQTAHEALKALHEFLENR